MTLISIAIGTAGALLGFYLGVRSKAVAKRKALDKKKRQVENLNTFVNRNAPPPPPPPKKNQITAIVEKAIAETKKENKKDKCKHKKPGP